MWVLRQGLKYSLHQLFKWYPPDTQVILGCYSCDTGVIPWSVVFFQRLLQHTSHGLRHIDGSPKPHSFFSQPGKEPAAHFSLALQCHKECGRAFRSDFSCSYCLCTFATTHSSAAGIQCSFLLETRGTLWIRILIYTLGVEREHLLADTGVGLDERHLMKPFVEAVWPAYENWCSTSTKRAQ